MIKVKVMLSNDNQIILERETFYDCEEYVINLINDNDIDSAVIETATRSACIHRKDANTTGCLLKRATL